MRFGKRVFCDGIEGDYEGYRDGRHYVRVPDNILDIIIGFTPETFYGGSI